VKSGMFDEVGPVVESGGEFVDVPAFRAFGPLGRHRPTNLLSGRHAVTACGTVQPIADGSQ